MGELSVKSRGGGNFFLGEIGGSAGLEKLGLFDRGGGRFYGELSLGGVVKLGGNMGGR